MGWIDLQHTVKALRRFVIALEFIQYRSPIVVRVGIAGFELNGTIVNRYGVLVAPAVTEYIAKYAVCMHIQRIPSGCFRQQVDCLLCAACLLRNYAQQAKCIEVVWVRMKEGFAQLFGLGKLTLSIAPYRL